MSTGKAAVFTALLLVAGASAASSAPADRFDEPGIGDCVEPVPAQVSVNDDGHESVLDVHFVLDGVDLSQAQHIVELAQRPYGEIDVRLDPTFEEVTFEPTGTTADGLDSIDPGILMDLTREHMRGFRPHGSDVVYTMTSKELVSSGAVGSAVAGQADCIGGVRFPDYAFAVGEVRHGSEYLDLRNARIAAHEIAHLLGAHHHYANCAQGNPDDLVDDYTPCTVMFNDVSLISLRFSTAEGAVVRGHMLSYADRTPTGPPEPIERSISFRIKNGRAYGIIEMEEFYEGCVDDVTVTIQRSSRAGWHTVGSTVSDYSGVYKARVPSRIARYRAVAARAETHDGVNWRSCPEVSSRVIRAR